MKRYMLLLIIKLSTIVISTSKKKKILQVMRKKITYHLTSSHILCSRHRMLLGNPIFLSFLVTRDILNVLATCVYGVDAFAPRLTRIVVHCAYRSEPDR